MSPAYDIAMHMHHHDEQRRSALDINGKVYYAEMAVADLVAEARGWGMPQRRAQRVVDDTVEAVRAALAAIDPGDYPGVSTKALSTVAHRLPPPVARPATGAARAPRAAGGQGRATRGTPTGGRRTATVHEEADIELAE